VEVFPIEHHSNIDPKTGRYQKDFIVANYELAENKIDLTLKQGKGATTKAANMYSGRSILTPQASTQLTQQINTYIFKEVFPLYYTGNGPRARGLKAQAMPMSRWGKDDLLKQIDAVEEWYLEKSLRSAQDQNVDPSLTAFRGRKVFAGARYEVAFTVARRFQRRSAHAQANAAVGRRRSARLQGIRTFAKSVQDTSTTPSTARRTAERLQPDPLRHDEDPPTAAGGHFGQVKKLDAKKLLTSEPLSVHERRHRSSACHRGWSNPHASTSAGSPPIRNEQEMNDHPATTPICGWVLANHLDDSLMIYDNRGKALGSLVKKNGVTWLSAPGGGGTRVVDDIANPHLKKMVKTIQGLGTGFLDSFITAIDSAVKNIEPENFAQHQDLALLMGRPLALVRASVNLEVKGLPVTHQGWNEFRQNMKDKTRGDNGFSTVNFRYGSANTGSSTTAQSVTGGRTIRANTKIKFSSLRKVMR
jgi:hypothetical protein